MKQEVKSMIIVCDSCGEMNEIEKQTLEERIKMYRKIPKKMLAAMLAARDIYEFPDGCVECRRQKEKVGFGSYTFTEKVPSSPSAPVA